MPAGIVGPAAKQLPYIKMDPVPGPQTYVGTGNRRMEPRAYWPVGVCMGSYA